MKNPICDEISPQLVDYVDSELSSEQAQYIEGHLASCPDCSKLVKALDQSLSIAQGLWEDAYQKAGEIPLPKLSPVKTPSWPRYAAVAAGIALLTSVFWLIPKQQGDAQLSLAQVQEQVHQSARAAQLLTATRMLSECAGTEELVQQQLQYIQTQYSDVPDVRNMDAGKKL
jgi:anti-sigma factor RsiW